MTRTDRAVPRTAEALDEFDEYVLSVVTGSYRQLWRGKREITVISEHRKRSSGFKHRRFNLGGLMMRARSLARPLPASASSVALLRGFKVGPGSILWFMANF